MIAILAQDKYAEKREQIFAACKIVFENYEKEKFIGKQKLIDCVINAVSAFYNVSPVDVKNTNIRGECTKPRNIIYLLLWRLKQHIHQPTFSTYDIANIFNVYQSNVVKDKNNFTQKLANNAALRNDFAVIEEYVLSIIKQYSTVEHYHIKYDR